ncbi:MAG: hypothetical protein WAV79_09145 [Anaerolineae bacterium]
MMTVAIRDKYVEVLRPFGSLEDAVNLALQRYAIEQVTTKIAELRRRDVVYQEKYGMRYPAFVEYVGRDETFVEMIERTISKTWEIDLADWEFCHHGMQDWTRGLSDDSSSFHLPG